MTNTYDHYWEQWVASSAPPQEVRKKHARRYQRDDHTWITYHDTIRGQHVIVDMPTNAATATCHRGRHDHCPHRLGQPQEGGVWFQLPHHRGVLWRCGCPCHNKPMDAGRLF